MNSKQIDRFFSVLSRELDEPARVILTGAAAGALWGRIRMSADVDFEVRLRRSRPALWQKLEQAVERATDETGLLANFGESIDRWNMVTFLDYRQHLTAWRRFGTLRVFLMDPVFWSIGKMTRFTASDVEDVIRVFQKQNTPWPKACRTWGKALRKSPKSVELSLFRKQVDYFLKNHGKLIWGPAFPIDKALEHFHSASAARR